MTVKKPFVKTLSAIAASVLVVACSNDNTNDIQDDLETIGATGSFQIIHASPDAPAVSVVTNIGIPANLDFGDASARIAFPVGSLNVDVRVASLTGGDPASVIGPVDLPISANTLSTIIAVDNVADLAPLVVNRSTSPIAPTDVRVQVVHGAPNAPSVDVYVTAPDAELADSAPIGTFQFGEDLGPLDVPAGEYRIRVAVAGTQNVAFDSGPVPLPAEGDLTVVAIENTDTGTSPIDLLVVPQGDAEFVIQDSATPGAVRVVHASPDAPAVDVLVNDTIELVDGAAYTQDSGFLDVAPGTYNIKVVPDGATTPVVIEVDEFGVEAGEFYNVLAIGLLGDETITALPLNSDRRRVGTYAKLQIVHGSPVAGTVDVYLTAVGADLTEVAPTLNDFAFGSTTGGFIAVPAGEYDVTIEVGGEEDGADDDKTVLLGPATVNLSNGGLYTVIAADAQRLNPGDSGLPAQLILLDDFVNL